MKPGDVIENKYRIEAKLGEGGMGRVLAATHLDLGSQVAIKVLKPDALSHPEVPMRFMREARAAGRLRNEHVARVVDVGRTASGEPYMVMEMLHGYDLATRLQQGALEPPRAVEYIVQACEGLAEAHALGMVHRDIKPANLFVTQRPNGTPLVKLLDFGIATAAIGDVDHRLTTTQSVIGSPSYMSPEQLRATRDVDQRSDIWSLGVTLYELLADRQPFVAPTITALSLKIVSDPHPPIEGIPLELMAIIDRCLEKDREHRFANVAELAAALAPLFPNGKVAAELVSGVFRQPVPPTLVEVDAPPDPSQAGWRLPSAPAMTTTGFAAGESAALDRPRRRRGAWIAVVAAGGLAAAAVAGIGAMRTSSQPGAASAASSGAAPANAATTTPPAVPAAAAPPAVAPAPPPAPVAPAATPAPAAEPPAPVARPVERPAVKPAKRRPAKKPKPEPKPAPRPDPVVTPPAPPQDAPPPPKPPQPCSPTDKTCGL